MSILTVFPRIHTREVGIMNRAKSFCGLCCILYFFTAGSAAATPKPDSTYTTAQILSYLQGKVFTALSTVPNVKGSVGARHSIWQTGTTDSITDFVYSDFSNTRLEAKIEIPIFDLSYLRNKNNEKLEHRAFVMKSLSQILAAQKSVTGIESRIATLRARHKYTTEQINLKLANRTDLFNYENEIFAQQTLLYEAQSTLEQRIIDLAILAGRDWLEAYAMIIKWDGVLFDKVKK
jgi:hypothetical protein